MDRIHDVYISSRAYSLRFLIRGEGSLHVMANVDHARGMIGHTAVDFLIAMHQSDGDGILTAERALAWGMAIPAIAENDDDVEVPLMQYEVEAVTFQRGAYWAKVPGCNGFRRMAFCTLRDGSRNGIGSVAHLEYLLAMEKDLADGGVRICDNNESACVM